MKNTFFTSFHAAFPPSAERASFNAARHQALAAKVPEMLASEWMNVGFGAYGAGLLWTPVPDEPFLDPKDWPMLDGSEIEVLRTAFADVCLWQGDHFLWVNVLSGQSVVFDPNVEILFDGFTEKNFRKTVLLERIFKIACKRYGSLNADECFGFAPLPMLGGAIAEEYVTKVKMRPYLAMVSQVLG